VLVVVSVLVVVVVVAVVETAVVVFAEEPDKTMQFLPEHHLPEP